jgi:seryl-tRNA synthetase
MLDIKLIRENTELVRKGLASRNSNIALDELLELDVQRRKVLTELEELKAKRNKISEEVGKYKREKKEVPAEITSGIEAMRGKIGAGEIRVAEVEQKIADIMLSIPNMPDESVPVGKSAEDNKVVFQSAQPSAPAFKPKPHWEIGEKLGILDFETASKISGARFAMLKGDGCVLERALISFFLDTHRARGYQEVMTPYLVSPMSLTGTGQLPKFEDELFKCKDDELYLIPTAEVPVTNIHRGEMLEEKTLPKYYVSYSACFRREAGSYGKDTRGLIRNHQFNKVELVKIVAPESSMQELEKMNADAGEVLKLLGLPYRVIALCTGDMGFASAKTYDLEVWMPAEQAWREISSCSNCKDFQARRMETKVKYGDKRKEFVHTLNGSGVAVGRAFAAILENFQQADGSVMIPEALRRYTGFDAIRPK